MITRLFKPSIVHYASVSDIRMILDELIMELTVFDDSTNQKLIQILNTKQNEILQRYTR